MEKRKISKVELEALYHSMPVREVAEKLGITVMKFYELLASAGIRKKSANRRPRVEYEIVE